MKKETKKELTRAIANEREYNTNNQITYQEEDTIMQNKYRFWNIDYLEINDDLKQRMLSIMVEKNELTAIKELVSITTKYYQDNKSYFEDQHYHRYIALIEHIKTTEMMDILFEFIYSNLEIDEPLHLSMPYNQDKKVYEVFYKKLMKRSYDVSNPEMEYIKNNNYSISSTVLDDFIKIGNSDLVAWYFEKLSKENLEYFVMKETFEKEITQMLIWGQASMQMIGKLLSIVKITLEQELMIRHQLNQITMDDIKEKYPSADLAKRIYCLRKEDYSLNEMATIKYVTDTYRDPQEALKYYKSIFAGKELKLKYEGIYIMSGGERKIASVSDGICEPLLEQLKAEIDLTDIIPASGIEVEINRIEDRLKQVILEMKGNKDFFRNISELPDYFQGIIAKELKEDQCKI